MVCAYCSRAATHLDLCHSRVPVCKEHTGLGHQLEAIPKAAPPKRDKG